MKDYGEGNWVHGNPRRGSWWAWIKYRFLEWLKK